MTRTFKRPVSLALAAAIGAAALVATPAMAGGKKAAHGHHAAMKATVVDVAVGSPDHTTLVAAVKAAGLVSTLQGPGPFTVFAPTNAAFAKLPAGTVDTLLKPENKGTLTKVLTYHVVPGKVMAADLAVLIRQGGGMATVKTVAGETLTARMNGANIVITDAKGGTSTVTAANLKAGNGVVHVVDSVFLPG